MAVVEASGSAALTSGGAAVALSTISTNRILTLILDLVDMVDGDAIVCAISTKVLNSGTSRSFITWTFSGVQAPEVQISLPVDSPYECILTLQQTTGVSRTIPYSIESIGSVTSEAEGTQTAVISTMHSLAAPSGNKNYSLVADLNAMIAGDTVELYVRRKVLTGGVIRDILLGTYSGVQSQPIAQSNPVNCPYGAEFKLRQTAGTGRAFPWRVDSFG